MIRKELERFEKAFRCKGFLERERTNDIATSFARIFYYAMTLEDFSGNHISMFINKSRVAVCYHLRKVTPIEQIFAKEFVENKEYEYNGMLGEYND